MSTNNGFIGIPIGMYGWPYSTSYNIEDDDVSDVKVGDGRDGCTCKKCQNFSPYSVPNQEDKSFICYGCRHGY